MGCARYSSCPALAGHIFRTWKKRWFVLEEQLLKYYKAADESTSSSAAAGQPETVGDSDMKGCISIQSCKVVALAPADAAGRSYCFQLTPVPGKIFLICASDEQSREQWMEAIKLNAAPREGGAATTATDQTPAPEPPEPQPEDVGNVIGKETVTLADFELLKVIGRGTYGKVMQVRRRDTGEILAMKVLKKENIFARNDPKDLQHTISERNVLALVNNEAHPFILGLRTPLLSWRQIAVVCSQSTVVPLAGYAFHTPAKLYYVLNFCNGGDLYYLCAPPYRSRPVPERSLRCLFFTPGSADVRSSKSSRRASMPARCSWRCSTYTSLA